MVCLLTFGAYVKKKKKKRRHVSVYSLNNELNYVCMHTTYLQLFLFLSLFWWEQWERGEERVNSEWR